MITATAAKHTSERALRKPQPQEIFHLHLKQIFNLMCKKPAPWMSSLCTTRYVAFYSSQQKLRTVIKCHLVTDKGIHFTRRNSNSKSHHVYVIKNSNKCIIMCNQKKKLYTQKTIKKNKGKRTFT